MKIKAIHTSTRFRRSFIRLPQSVQKRAAKAEQLFRENVFHPSLRLHKLKGRLDHLWSISIDKRHRILFEVMEEGVVMFVDIGAHSVYEF